MLNSALDIGNIKLADLAELCDAIIAFALDDSWL